MDEQKALLQGLWRKAFRQDTPLEIPCKSETNARKMRFALYNAVRGVKTGKEKVDENLKEAVENCSVGFAPDDKTRLVIQRKVMTEMMQIVSEILGEDATVCVKTEKEMEVEASITLALQKIRENGEESVVGQWNEDPGLQSLPGLPRSTPYYTR